MLSINPFGRTTDWSFNAWTRLWPLYKILWFFPGRDTGRTVASTNPKQLFKGNINISLQTNRIQNSIVPLRYPVSMSFIQVLKYSIGYHAQNRDRFSNCLIISLHGYEKRLRSMHSPSNPSHVVPCSQVNDAGIWRTWARTGISPFRKRKSVKHTDSSCSRLKISCNASSGKSGLLVLKLSYSKVNSSSLISPSS